MKLIIDGYNLIKNVAPSKHISTQVRDQYLKQLGEYAKNKGLQILIVFDGGQASFNYRESVYGLQIIYSGFLESADDVINRYIADYRSNEEVMIISSDFEIVSFAVQRGIDTLKSEDFYELMQAGLKIASQPLNLTNRTNKLTNTNNPELDRLMEDSSCEIKPKTEELAPRRMANIKKLSKHEKQILKKLKKL